MPPRALLSLAITLFACLVATTSAVALPTTVCPHASDFRCGTLTVPLDRTGRVPGSVRLAFAVEAPRRGTTGYLLALSGGPGQPSIEFADSFRASLAPALQHRRLVVLDQRGTGESGALSCPPLQALGSLDVVNTQIVASCAQRLGPARQFYATADSVQDIDALRQALGAPGLELMGVSYGTYVAVQYARTFPAHTDGLILDSTVGPDGIDAYFLDTFARLPRVLRDQCARGRCRGATRDPMADLSALAARLARSPLRGRIRNARGQAVPTALHDESELLLTIMSGDLNPFMQAALPGAIGAAVNGDPAPLLRLRPLANGPATPVKEFSSTLNVATTCADTKLPYTFEEPIAERWARWIGGAAAVPESLFVPFSRQAVVDTSVAHDCLRWPVGDQFTPPSDAPLPDVPALILSGRLDTRTPLENAREMRALLPHAQLVPVGGTGHDVLDSDITGCAARALRLFADGVGVGDPCRGKSNAVGVLARPPLALSAYRSAPGVGGERGRLLFATLDSVVDSEIFALETLYAGFSPVRGGGLRGGSFSASGDVTRLRLRRYAYVPRVALTGTIRAEGQHASGVVRVDGPGHLDGVLRLHADGSVTGVLDGRHVRYREPGSAALAALRAGRAASLPGDLRVAAWVAAARRQRALRRTAGW